MPWFDLPESELRSYRTAATEPAGLDAWWTDRLGEARAAAGETTLTPYRPDLYGPGRVSDVSFTGARGDRVRAWYVTPVGVTGTHPVLVHYVGYGGGRSLPIEHLAWSALGIGLLVMDTRGQGGRWSVGSTPDGTGTTGERAEVMTRGIESPEDYYFTRLYADAVRAVDVAAQLPGADPARVGVTGASQGGGLALAAAALARDTVRVCAADVPFLCDIARAATVTDEYPYREIADFLALRTDLVEPARRTLSYVDNALLATRIQAETMVTVGLMDPVCPPSTVFAAYNAIAASKRISVSPFGVHAQSRFQDEERVQFLRERLLG